MNLSFWPQGLIFSLVVFMAGTSAFVYTSFQHRVDLVRPDYYEQDMQWNKRRESEERARKMPGVITVSYRENILRLKFQKSLLGSDLSGKVVLYDNLNPKNDKQITFQNLGRDGILSRELNLRSGKWKVFIEYQRAGKNYFQQSDLII